METKKILRGKRVLIVDDEKDVLNVLVELLDMCKIDTASSFEQGKQLLETEPICWKSPIRRVFQPSCSLPTP
jgi:CheY-like chemotaxis protein